MSLRFASDDGSRFHAPDWATHLRKHLGGADDYTLFERAVKLKTGEALLFAPTAVLMREPSAANGWTEDDPAAPLVARAKTTSLGRGWVLMKTRQRVTLDGGASVLATRGAAPTTFRSFTR